MSDLTRIPDAFAAGSDVKYTASHPDYPASAGWVLRLLVRRAGVGGTSVEGDANGDSHDIHLTAEVTAGLSAELYDWAHEYEKAGEKYIAVSGQVRVTPNLRNADAQSHTERVLVALYARLEGRITADQETIQLDNMAISRIPFIQIPRWIAFYEAQRASERGESGGIGRIHLQFRRPS